VAWAISSSATAFHYYHHLQTASEGEQLAVCYQTGSILSDRASFQFRIWAPGQGWSAETAFHGRYSCVALFEGELYKFRARGYAVYSRRRHLRTVRAVFPGAVVAAGPVGGELWAFARSPDGQVVAQRVVPPAKPERYAYPLLTAESEQFQVAGDGDRLYAVWTEPSAEAGRWYLGRAEWDTFSRRWRQVRRDSILDGPVDLAAAARGDSLWVVVKARGRRITADHPLRYYEWKQGRWSKPQTIGGVVDEVLGRTLGLAAGWSGDRLNVFLLAVGTVRRVAIPATRWPVVVLARLSFTVVHVLLAALLAAALVCLVGVSLLRSRRFPTSESLAGVQWAYAGWGERMLAFALDVGLLVAVHLLALAALLHLGWAAEWALKSVTWYLIFPAVSLVYWTCCEARQGQSFGKRALQLRVTSTEGRLPGWRRALVRNLLMPLDVVIGLFLVLNTRRRQRLGDLLARTLVVRPLRSPGESGRAK